MLNFFKKRFLPLLFNTIFCCWITYFIRIRRQSTPLWTTTSPTIPLLLLFLDLRKGSAQIRKSNVLKKEARFLELFLILQLSFLVSGKFLIPYYLIFWFDLFLPRNHSLRERWCFRVDFWDININFGKNPTFLQIFSPPLLKMMGKLCGYGTFLCRERLKYNQIFIHLCKGNFIKEIFKEWQSYYK